MIATFSLAVVLALPVTVLAQAYPSKPVRVVVPYPPGSTPDIVGRTLSERLQKGFDVIASSPEEFSRWIRAESEKWSNVIRASGATAD